MSEPLTIACVNHGDYLGRGAEYVRRLRAMVERNLQRPFEFVCLEDEGDLGGWWAKLELFRPGRFSGRVAYFDLDSAIVAPLDDLVDTKGIIDLRDWGWPMATMCSSVMVWDAGEHADIYERFHQDVLEQFRGDQDWMTHLGGWESFPKHLCVSYRYACVKAPPAGCIHVSFHGEPKPHEIVTGWVPQIWRAP